jgi:GntR family transcriptional repressor for pyruvate dehydrogenase complex
MQKQTDVATDVLQKIRNLIETQRMRPGTRLPSERSLAAQLGVGRPAIREALKALSILDVIESRHGDGTYIKSLAGLSLGWSVKLDRIEENFDLLELLEVRKMFEPRAAALAAVRATPKQLQDLRRELRAQEAHLVRYPAFVRNDFNFHEGILRAAGNQILVDISRLLAPMLLKSRQITVRSTLDLKKIYEQHQTIFEAIRLRQPELAERAMLDHLQVAGLDLISPVKR